jgi:hypothetical protein
MMRKYLFFTSAPMRTPIGRLSASCAAWVLTRSFVPKKHHSSMPTATTE